MSTFDIIMKTFVYFLFPQPSTSKTKLFVRRFSAGLVNCRGGISRSNRLSRNSCCHSPGLGSNVTVTIQANDGAAGQVGFDERSSSLVVQEGSQVALSVNRTLPFGRVTVDWLVTGANASSDFVSINGTVEFKEVSVVFYVCVLVNSAEKEQ